MDKVTEKQKEEIKKTSTARLQLKLSRAGYSDEEIESFDRQTCMEKWADLVVHGIELLEQPQPQATVRQYPTVDIELERERFKFEQQKFADEMILRQTELKIKEDELRLQREKIKVRDELENTPSMKVKRFSDALKGSVIKMSADPIEIASFFRQMDSLFVKFDIPLNLQATLVKPYFNDKAKLLVSKLEPNVADDYKLLQEAVLREFKTTPAYLLNKFQNVNKNTGETYILYGSKLMTVLKYYLDSRSIEKDFKKLTELLVCDRVKATLDDACLRHILALENSSTDGWLHLDELTASIDRYYANCVSGPKKATGTPQVSGTVKHDGPVSTSQGWSPGTFGNKSQNNNASFNNRPQYGSVRRCYECNSPDHIRSSCPRIWVNSNVGHKHHNKSNVQQQTSTHTQTSKPIRRTEHISVNIEQSDIESIPVTTNTTDNVKNHVMTNNLCDLQYIDVVLSDESGNCSEVVSAVVDSGAEMCVARKEVIESLDCLTVGTCKLRGIIGDPFDVEVKRAYIGTSNGKTMVPVALACHELVHDALLLTPAVVNDVVQICIS